MFLLAVVFSYHPIVRMTILNKNRVRKVNNKTYIKEEKIYEGGGKRNREAKKKPKNEEISGIRNISENDI